MLSYDTLPKNVVKKFFVTEFKIEINSIFYTFIKILKLLNYFPLGLNKVAQVKDSFFDLILFTILLQILLVPETLSP